MNASANSALFLQSSALNTLLPELTAIEHHAPAWTANRQARSIAQAKTRLAQLERRSERVGRSPRPPASTLTLCSTSSPLANCVFVIQTSPADGTLFNNSNGKAALQKIRSTQSVELDLGSTRSLSFSSES